MKPECFVIMPIGHMETEFLWEDVYEPVIRDCGFNPDRIDISDDGSDMPLQIMKKISNANLVIADLTLERQNCYFELGYALGKQTDDTSVILCCRDDHNPRSPNYVNDGPQVHFDVITRYIVFWNPDKCDQFKSDLKKKILSRMKQIQAQAKTQEKEQNISKVLDKPKNQSGTTVINRLQDRLSWAREGVNKK